MRAYTAFPLSTIRGELHRTANSVAPKVWASSVVASNSAGNQAHRMDYPSYRAKGG